MSDNSPVTVTPVAQPEAKSPVEAITRNLAKPTDAVVEETELQATEVINDETESTEVEEEKPEVTKEDELLSSRFAALSRREKQLIEREKQYKAFEEKSKAFEDAVANIKQDPIKALSEVGLTFEELVELVLSEGASQDLTEEQKLAKKIQDLEDKLNKKDELESKSKQEIEEQKIKEEQEYIDTSIKKFKSKIESFVEENKDTYELISVHNAQDMIYEVIENVFNENGQTIDINIAADHVEEYLTQEASKLMGLKKFSTKKDEETQVDIFKTKKTLQENKVSPTLTNTMTPSTPQSVRQSDGKLLSAEESKKRAASLIKWD